MIKTYTLSALLLITLLHLDAQELSFSQIISDNSVYCMEMDSDNILWIGSEDGLIKYDSKNLKYYYYDPRDSSSLLDNSVRSILIDTEDRIWLGTRNGLNLYNRKKDNFQRFLLSTRDNKMQGSFITSIVEDPDGYIWIGTESSGLYRLDPETSEFNHFKANNTPSSLISNNIEDLDFDDNGSLWIASKEGIDYIDINSGEISHYYHRQGTLNSLPSNNLAIISVDKNGYVWTSSRDGFISYLDNNDNIHFQKNDYSVTAFLCSGDNFIFGTDEGNIFSRSLSSLYELDKIDFSINEASDIGIIRSLYVDKWNNIWAGTENGLFVDYSIKRNFYGAKGNTSALPISSVRDLIVDHQDRLWLVNESDILIQDGEEFIDFKSIVKSGNIGELEHIYTIYQDSKNIIWLGSFDNGLFRYDPLSGHLKQYTNDKNDPESLPYNCIWTMTEDHKGGLWIGSWGGGLIHYDREKDHFTNYNAEEGESNTLSNNKLISLVTDSEGVLWIGTDGGGLNRYNPLVEKFEVFTPRTNDPNSITDNSILCIHEDDKKRLWVGTDGGGLLLMDRERKSFKAYNHNHGLKNASVKSIIEDQDGKLWLATNGGGIFMFLPEDEKFIQFTTDDGLSTNRFFNGSVSSDKNGNFYFGGVNGYTSFHPMDIETDKLNPDIIINNIAINNTNLNFLEEFEKSAYENEKTISLKPSHKIITVNFSAVEYSPSSRNNYRYRLIGVNDQWIEIGKKTSISFMNLPQGVFNLEIQASNADGIWSNKSEVINLSVLPPFYKTPWFIISLLTVFGIIILLWNRMKLQELRKREKKLQIMVETRTHEVMEQAEKLALQNAKLEKQKEELAHQNDKITRSRERLRQMTKQVHEADEMKLRFFTNISHEFRTPLTLIIGPLENLINRLKYDDQALDQLLTMRRNAARLLRLIGQVMEFRKIDSGKLKLQARENNVVEFSGNIINSFKAYAEEKKVNLNFSYEPSEIKLYFDHDKLEKILYNLLSNAIRFTRERGNVNLIIKEHVSDLDEITDGYKKFVRFTVSDDGKGIPEEEIKNIFERFYQVKNPVQTSTHSGAGIGLALSRELVKLHKGSIEVRSKNNKGTEFIITFPSGSGHLDDDEIIKNNEVSVTGDEHLYNTLLLKNESEKQSDIPARNDEVDRVKLLIVEDNPELKDYLFNYFSAVYKVITAANGAEAYDLCRKELPEIVISDIIMPEMNGLDLCNAIKTDPEIGHIPVILLTAKNSYEDEIEGLKKQADAYVTKPFSPMVLLAKIENILANRKKLHEKYKRDILLEPENIELESNDDILLRKAMQVVEENISNSEFNVNLMSREIGISRAALYRKLKALTNQSVNIFVRDIRLKRAAQILLQDKITISEVAYMVGYNDVQYFRKCFTRHYKLTPSQYIEKHKSTDKK